MNMYLLNGGEQVALATRPLFVRIQSQVPVPLQLVARHPDGSAPVSFDRPGILILPRIVQPTTVTLLPPPGADRFGPQAVLTLFVGPEGGGDTNVDFAQLTLDVSGLPRQDVISLEPSGPTIKVTALSRPKDPSLPRQAEIARDVARELLGVAFASKPIDVVVGVDCSPSMRPLAGQGILEAALNLFAGLASVIDPNSAIEAVLCGRLETRLRSEAIDRFAAATLAEVQQQPLVTGCKSSVLHTSSDTITYLVTDGIPADLTRRPDAPPHVVVLAAPRFEEAQPVPTATRSTVVGVDRAADPAGVVWDRNQTRTILDSLLASYPHRPSPAGVRT